MPHDPQIVDKPCGGKRPKNKYWSQVVSIAAGKALHNPSVLWHWGWARCHSAIIQVSTPRCCKV